MHYTMVVNDIRDQKYILKKNDFAVLWLLVFMQSSIKFENNVIWQRKLSWVPKEKVISCYLKANLQPKHL